MREACYFLLATCLLNLDSVLEEIDGEQKALVLTNML